jgi:hypothetical protein
MQKTLRISLFFIFILIQSSLLAQWSQLGNNLYGEAASDGFGLSTSISSDGLTIAVGATGNDGNGNFAGHVRVFTNFAGTWTQLGADIDGEQLGDRSGHFVDLSADGLTVAIGAGYNDGGGFDGGHVRVYEYIAGAWVQKGIDLDAEAPFDRFGWSTRLSADGSTVIIGGYQNNDTGHVKVFKWISGAWVQQGVNIDGEAQNDDFGMSVSISDNGLTIAIGAPYNVNTNGSSGHTRVYDFVAGVWVQRGLDIDGEAVTDRSGHSVSLSSDGSIVAIGAFGNNDGATDAGQVRVYEWTGGSWSQVGADIDGLALDDAFGYSVDLSDDGLTFAAGAYANSTSGLYAGQTRIFNFNAGSWVQVGNDINAVAAGDSFGWSVGLSSDGSTVVIGGPGNDLAGSGAGYAQVYEVCAPNVGSETIVACNTYTWPTNATTYTSPGLYAETLTNAAGCDSIVTLDLTVNYSNAGTDVQTACNTYTWIDGNTYTSSNNSATWTETNAAGCDSVVTLDLTVNYSNTGTDVQTACNTYTWIDGNTYTSSNNSATWTETNAAGCDSIVTLDLTISYSNSGTDVQTACDTYTWIDGNTYTSSNSTATHTLTNVAGCDSVVTLNLTVETVDNGVTYNIIGGPPYTHELTSNQNGATYQWLNCPAMTPISGATNQSFTVTGNGEYAVEVTNGSCIDTSACASVTSVGIVENNFGNELLIYPNPTFGVVTIKLLDDGLNLVYVKLSNAHGQELSTNSYSQVTPFDVEIKGAPGVYFIEIETSEGRKAKIRILKQ